MKFVNIDDLNGNEILATPVISGSNIVLVHSDTILKPDLINKLRSYNIEYVYVKEENENDVIYTKEETYESSKAVVEKVLERHIYKQNDDLKVVGQEAERVLDSVLSTPDVIENITEIRNISTDMYSHCINVCALSTIMAMRLRMNEKQVKAIAIGAILHDIGLKYIQAPYIDIDMDEMSPAELLEYKKHTIYGYSSVQEETWLPDTAKDIILLHHERVDGKGFPFQQRRERLKTEVKLVSLCDDFDSLISGIGNKKVKIYEAIEYIRANIGGIYDPTIAAKFIESVAMYPIGMQVVTNEGEIGVVVRQNSEATDRPVIRMIKYPDGTPYEEYVEKNLCEALTLFIVDTL